MQKFIGGIGCFWDETKYEGIPGITSTECGYCGGKNPNVSYKEVCGGNTEHVEVVKIEFDPKIITYEEITRLFFKFHDPTTPNRQGPNVGHQYRSEIFYNSDEEKDIFLKDFANACDEMMKNPACDTDDDYKAIAEQVKMFR